MAINRWASQGQGMPGTASQNTGPVAGYKPTPPATKAPPPMQSYGGQGGAVRNAYEQFNQRGMPTASRANLTPNQLDTWQQRIAGGMRGNPNPHMPQWVQQRNLQNVQPKGGNPYMARLGGAGGQPPQGYANPSAPPVPSWAGGGSPNWNGAGGGYRGGYGGGAGIGGGGMGPRFSTGNDFGNAWAGRPDWMRNAMANPWFGRVAGAASPVPGSSWLINRGIGALDQRFPASSYEAPPPGPGYRGTGRSPSSGRDLYGSYGGGGGARMGRYNTTIYQRDPNRTGPVVDGFNPYEPPGSRNPWEQQS